ncbi:MAG: hypothetical protein ACPG4T_24240 [Nannocystaceae bacterium]
MQTVSFTVLSYRVATADDIPAMRAIRNGVHKKPTGSDRAQYKQLLARTEKIHGLLGHRDGDEHRDD